MLLYIRNGFILRSKTELKLTDEFRYPSKTLYKTNDMLEITNTSILEPMTRTI